MRIHVSQLRRDVPGEPGVLQDCVQGDAVVGGGLQQGVQQVLRLRAQLRTRSRKPRNLDATWRKVPTGEGADRRRCGLVEVRMASKSIS